MSDSKVLDIVLRLKDEIGAGVASAGDKLKGFSNTAAVAGVAIGGLAIKLGKDAVDAFAESERGISVLETTLKSTKGAVGLTSDEIQKMAAAFQKTTAIEDDAVLAGQNMLLTFTSIGKDTFPGATEAMLNMATAMNGGVAPGAEQLRNQAIQLGKALNDPIDGLSSLGRVGVKFTAEQKGQITALLGTSEAMKTLQTAAGDAEMSIPKLQKSLEIARMKLSELEAGGKASGSSLLSAKTKVEDLANSLNDAEIMVKSYDEAQKANTSSMSEAEKMAKAQSIILKELSTEFGGQAAATLSNYTGKITQMKNQWDDVKETMGQALIPILMQLGTAISTVVVWLQQHEAVAKAIVPILLAVAGALVSIKVAMAAVSAVTSTIDLVKSLAKIPLPVLAVIAALALLAGAVYLIIKYWDDIKAKTIEVWTAIKDFFTGIWESVTGVFNSAISMIQTAWEIFIDAVFSQGYNRIEGILLGIAGVFDYIFGTNIGDILWKFFSFIQGFWESIKGVFNSVINFIVGIFVVAWEALPAPLQNVLIAIKDDIVNKFNAIKDFIMLVITAIKLSFEVTWNAISTFFSEKLNTIKNFFSVIWEEIKFTALAIWQPIQDKITAVMDWIASFFTTAKDVVAAPFRGIFDGLVFIIEAVFADIKGRVMGVVDWLSGIWSKVTGLFSKISSKGSEVTGLNIAGARASGGFVGKGSTYLVGEQGAELFTPSTSGMIHPNSSGGGINITISGNSFAGQSREMADQMFEMLMRKLKTNLIV